MSYSLTLGGMCAWVHEGGGVREGEEGWARKALVVTGPMDCTGWKLGSQHGLASRLEGNLVEGFLSIPAESERGENEREGLTLSQTRCVGDLDLTNPHILSRLSHVEKMFPVLQLSISGFGVSLEPAFLEYIRALPLHLLTVPLDGRATEGTSVYL